MLVNEGLYCVLWRLKIWRWLCLPDLQLRTLYCDFLHAQRMCANLPALLLVLLWFLCLEIQGLEIHQGNTSNTDQQTWVTDVCKLAIFFSNALLHFPDQITRSEMSSKDKSRMWFHPLSNGLITGFKRPVLMIDVSWCTNQTYFM